MVPITELPGVIITPLKIIPSENGSVMHALLAGDPGFCGFGEAYFSTVFPGVIKGWKRHKKMTLNLVVPIGKIEFVLLDDRAASSKMSAVVLGRDCYARLTVPPGIWVAFKGWEGASENVLLNLANIAHDPDEAENRAYPAHAHGMPEVTWRL